MSTTDVQTLIERCAKVANWKSGGDCGDWISQDSLELYADDGLLTPAGTLALQDRLLRAHWSVFITVHHEYCVLNGNNRNEGGLGDTLANAVMEAYLIAFEPQPTQKVDQ